MRGAWGQPRCPVLSGVGDMESRKAWDFDQYDWIGRYDERMLGLARLCYGETLGQLASSADANAGQWVLDIGTGTGNSAVPFLERICAVVGVDPSRVMLTKAAEKADIGSHKGGAGRDGVFLLVRARDPFLALPFRSGTFDIVVSAYAIHHVEYARQADCAVEVGRVLKPNGVAVIADTMFRDAAHKAEALARHTDLEDEYQPLLDSFPQVWEAAGFSVSLRQVGELVWILTAKKLALGALPDA